MANISPVDKTLTSPHPTPSDTYSCYLGRIVCILSKVCHKLSCIYKAALLLLQKPNPVTKPSLPQSITIAKTAEHRPTVTRHYLPRRSKVNKSALSERALRIPPALLQHAEQMPPIATLSFGAGMENGGNTCYMAAVLQALRFVPSFQSHLLTKSTLTKELRHLFSHIQAEKNRPAMLLQADDTSRFRKVCMDHGWQPDSEYSQEDPRQFCQFLLDTLGFPPFRFRTKIEHPLTLEVPSLERQGGLENYIELSLGEATDGTALEEVAGNAFVMEEVEKAQIPFPEQADPVAFQQQLDKLADITMIPTQQAIQLTDIPQLLPVALRRDRFDRETLTCTKATTQIVPSEILEFALTTNPDQKARYRLVSIVVRDGTSASCGHCRTFIPIEGKYIEFNDSRSVLHVDPKPVDALIYQHGLLFFYELVGITYTSS